MNDPHSLEENRIRLTDPLHTGSPHSSLILPKPLPPGGRIAVLGISSPADPERVLLAADGLRNLGYEVVLAENLFDSHLAYLAGSDEIRAETINRFLNDPSFHAFLFSRGGYGAMRILDRIDYSAIRQNPRPIIGYSDITALHSAIASQAGVASFHGPMLQTNFHDGMDPEALGWFQAMLTGQSPLSLEFTREQVLSPGVAEGILVGGCLSLTVSLLGTPFDYWADDGIWFWEDTGEPVYRLDRMLTHLRLSGRLNRIQGVMIGTLKAVAENDPRELDDLLVERFSDTGIPVIRALPFGHEGVNRLLPVGSIVRIDTFEQAITFPYPVVNLSYEGF